MDVHPTKNGINRYSIDPYPYIYIYKLQSDLSSADTAGELDRLEFLFTSCTVKYPWMSNSQRHMEQKLGTPATKKSWNRFDFIYTCHPGLPRTPGVGHWSKKARRPETCHLVTSLMDFGGIFVDGWITETSKRVSNIRRPLIYIYIYYIYTVHIYIYSTYIYIYIPIGP